MDKHLSQSMLGFLESKVDETLSVERLYSERHASKVSFDNSAGLPREHEISNLPFGFEAIKSCGIALKIRTRDGALENYSEQSELPHFVNGSSGNKSNDDDTTNSEGYSSDGSHDLKDDTNQTRHGTLKKLTDIYTTSGDSTDDDNVISVSASFTSEVLPASTNRNWTQKLLKPIDSPQADTFLETLKNEIMEDVLTKEYTGEFKTDNTGFECLPNVPLIGKHNYVTSDEDTSTEESGDSSLYSEEDSLLIKHLPSSTRRARSTHLPHTVKNALMRILDDNTPEEFSIFERVAGYPESDDLVPSHPSSSTTPATRSTSFSQIGTERSNNCRSIQPKSARNENEDSYLQTDVLAPLDPTATTSPATHKSQISQIGSSRNNTKFTVKPEVNKIEAAGLQAETTPTVRTIPGVKREISHAYLTQTGLMESVNPKKCKLSYNTQKNDIYNQQSEISLQPILSQSLETQRGDFYNQINNTVTEYQDILEKYNSTLNCYYRKLPTMQRAVLNMNNYIKSDFFNEDENISEVDYIQNLRELKKQVHSLCDDITSSMYDVKEFIEDSIRTVQSLRDKYPNGISKTLPIDLFTLIQPCLRELNFNLKEIDFLIPKNILKIDNYYLIRRVISTEFFLNSNSIT